VGAGAWPLTFCKKNLPSQAVTPRPAQKTHKGSSIIQTIAAIILFGILAFGSVHLKTTGLVESSGLVVLISFSVMSGFIVYFQDRIKKAGLSGLELHQAVKNVKDAEDRIRELANSVADLVEAGNSGSIKNCDYDHAGYTEALAKVRKL